VKTRVNSLSRQQELKEKKKKRVTMKIPVG